MQLHGPWAYSFNMLKACSTNVSSRGYSCRLWGARRCRLHNTSVIIQNHPEQTYALPAFLCANDMQIYAKILALTKQHYNCTNNSTSQGRRTCLFIQPTSQCRHVSRSLLVIVQFALWLLTLALHLSFLLIPAGYCR